MIARRAGWWFAAGVLVIEFGVIGTHPRWAKAILRSVYLTLWTYTPKLDGVEPPDRFK